MRGEALALSVLLAAAATDAIRADDIPNLSGSWKLVGVTDGRDERPVPDHVLKIRQEGHAITVETVIGGGTPHITTFTIGARTPTTDRYMETKARVDKQTLIVEAKPFRPRGMEDFFGDIGLDERRRNGDGSASRRSMLAYPTEPICVNPVRRTTYRASGDGATLEMREQQVHFSCGPERRLLFKRQ